jgi:hypothetical protein
MSAQPAALTALREPATPAERYTRELAARVADLLIDYGASTDPVEMAEVVVGEALFQAALDVRRGRTVHLEYLGELGAAHDDRGSRLRLRAAPELLTPYPTPEVTA